MNAERLLLVAEIVEGVPEHRLCMSSFKSWCGTTCCAIGWACHDRRVTDTGLRLVTDETGSYEVVFRNADGDVYENFAAIETWADISAHDAEYLFNDVDPDTRDFRGGGRDTPSTVARRIRDYVAKHRLLDEFGGWMVAPGPMLTVNQVEDVVHV